MGEINFIDAPIWKNRKTSHLLFILLSCIFIANLSYAKSERLTHGKQTIQVDYSYNFSQSDLDQTQRWLKKVTDSLLMVYGEWPKDNFEIKVRTTHRGKGPVPWGQVNRDDPDRVSLYLNPDYGFKAVADDWTAYHELCHLLIPYQGYGDLWISEGIASYYQNILQARSGRLNQKQFWSNLLSGFERGKEETNWPHIKLLKLSENPRRYRNFMRVHWSGVLFWLTADVNVRELSDNKQSLDTLLLQLKNCCEKRAMSSKQIMQTLDGFLGESIFTPLFFEFRNSFRMPDYQPLVIELGMVKKNKYSPLKINKDAKLATVGRQIFKGKYNSGD